MLGSNTGVFPCFKLVDSRAPRTPFVLLEPPPLIPILDLFSTTILKYEIHNCGEIIFNPGVCFCFIMLLFLVAIVSSNSVYCIYKVQLCHDYLRI